MRALEADALDRPRRIVVFDRLSDAERPVEDDRERGEKVGKDALRGETDRDAADAEPGDEAGDIDPHIVEDDDRRDREQRDADQQTDAPHRDRQSTRLNSRHYCAARLPLSAWKNNR